MNLRRSFAKLSYNDKFSIGTTLYEITDCTEVFIYFFGSLSERTYYSNILNVQPTQFYEKDLYPNVNLLGYKGYEVIFYHKRNILPNFCMLICSELYIPISRNGLTLYEFKKKQ